MGRTAVGQRETLLYYTKNRATGRQKPGQGTRPRAQATKRRRRPPMSAPSPPQASPSRSSTPRSNSMRRESRMAGTRSAPRRAIPIEPKPEANRSRALSLDHGMPSQRELVILMPPSLARHKTATSAGGRSRPRATVSSDRIFAIAFPGGDFFGSNAIRQQSTSGAVPRHARHRARRGRARLVRAPRAAPLHRPRGRAAERRKPERPGQPQKVGRAFFRRAAQIE